MPEVPNAGDPGANVVLPAEAPGPVVETPAPAPTPETSPPATPEPAAATPTPEAAPPAAAPPPAEAPASTEVRDPETKLEEMEAIVDRFAVLAEDNQREAFNKYKEPSQAEKIRKHRIRWLVKGIAVGVVGLLSGGALLGPALAGAIASEAASLITSKAEEKWSGEKELEESLREIDAGRLARAGELAKKAQGTKEGPRDVYITALKEFFDYLAGEFSQTTDEEKQKKAALKHKKFWWTAGKITASVLAGVAGGAFASALEGGARSMMENQIAEHGQRITGEGIGKLAERDEALQTMQHLGHNVHKVGEQWAFDYNPGELDKIINVIKPGESLTLLPGTMSHELSQSVVENYITEKIRESVATAVLGAGIAEAMGQKPSVGSASRERLDRDISRVSKGREGVLRPAESGTPSSEATRLPEGLTPGVYTAGRDIVLENIPEPYVRSGEIIYLDPTAYNSTTGELYFRRPDGSGWGGDAYPISREYFTNGALLSTPTALAPPIPVMPEANTEDEDLEAKTKDENYLKEGEKWYFVSLLEGRPKVGSVIKGKVKQVPLPEIVDGSCVIESVAENQVTFRAQEIKKGFFNKKKGQPESRGYTISKEDFLKYFASETATNNRAAEEARQATERETTEEEDEGGEDENIRKVEPPPEEKWRPIESIKTAGGEVKPEYAFGFMTTGPAPEPYKFVVDNIQTSGDAEDDNDAVRIDFTVEMPGGKKLEIGDTWSRGDLAKIDFRSDDSLYIKTRLVELAVVEAKKRAVPEEPPKDEKDKTEPPTSEQETEEKVKALFEQLKAKDGLDITAGDRMYDYSFDDPEVAPLLEEISQASGTTKISKVGSRVPHNQKGKLRAESFTIEKDLDSVFVYFETVSIADSEELIKQGYEKASYLTKINGVDPDIKKFDDEVKKRQGKDPVVVRRFDNRFFEVLDVIGSGEDKKYNVKSLDASGTPATVEAKLTSWVDWYVKKEGGAAPGNPPLGEAEAVEFTDDEKARIEPVLAEARAWRDMGAIEVLKMDGGVLDAPEEWWQHFREIKRLCADNNIEKLTDNSELHRMLAGDRARLTLEMDGENPITKMPDGKLVLKMKLHVEPITNSGGGKAEESPAESPLPPSPEYEMVGETIRLNFGEAGHFDLKRDYPEAERPEIKFAIDGRIIPVKLASALRPDTRQDLSGAADISFKFVSANKKEITESIHLNTFRALLAEPQNAGLFRGNNVREPEGVTREVFVASQALKDWLLKNAPPEVEGSPPDVEALGAPKPNERIEGGIQFNFEGKSPVTLIPDPAHKRSFLLGKGDKSIKGWIDHVEVPDGELGDDTNVTVHFETENGEPRLLERSLRKWREMLEGKNG